MAGPCTTAKHIAAAAAIGRRIPNDATDGLTSVPSMFRCRGQMKRAHSTPGMAVKQSADVAAIAR